MKNSQGNKNKSALLSVTVDNRRLMISVNLPFYRTLVILTVVTGYPILQAVLKAAIDPAEIIEIQNKIAREEQIPEY